MNKCKPFPLFGTNSGWKPTIIPQPIMLPHFQRNNYSLSLEITPQGEAYGFAVLGVTRERSDLGLCSVPVEVSRRRTWETEGRPVLLFSFFII